MIKSKDFQTFVETLRESECDFYRTLWNGAPAQALPIISRKDLARTPLSQRRYKDGKGILKIISDTEGMFFSEWNIEDIKTEPFGIPSSRPMAYFQNSYETTEKAWWCYMNGMMRCAGEANIDIAIAMATKFKITSLIADSASALTILPHLKMRGPLESITVIDAAFDTAVLAPLVEHTRTLRLVLALPETGAFAASVFSSSPSFSVLPGCGVEDVDGSIVLTKAKLLVTPIVRYDTGLRTADLAVHSRGE